MVGAAILMSIIFSAVTIYFLTIQTGQATRSEADIEAVDYYNQKLTAEFEIVSEDNLANKDANGNGIVVIDLKNKGPIAINAALLIVYNKTTSEILYQKDLRPGSPNGVGITVNGGETIKTTTHCGIDVLGNPQLCDHLLSYRIDIIAERGNIASTTWPPPPASRLGINLQEVFEFASASTIASGLGAIQLDFKSFGVIFPDYQMRDGVDQTGWKVKTDKAVGYSGFRIPEDQRTHLTIRVRNVDPSYENMTLLHDTGLVVNLASDQNAQQDAAVFLCNSTQSEPSLSVGAYDESDPARTITLVNAHGNVSLTARWYNLIFCDTDPIRGTVNYLPNWAADLQNNAIPINPTFLVARGEFVESHRQYGQTIPFQGVTITSGTFTACLKYLDQSYADCSPGTDDKYRASNSTLIDSGTAVYLKPIGGTGPYTVTWTYPDGTYRVLEEWVNVDALGNIQIDIPRTNQTGGDIQPGFYIIQVLDWNYNVYSMTFYVKADNNFPVAQDFSRSTNEDVPLTIDIPTEVPGDPDGDPLYVYITAFPTNGTVSVNPSGSITYTPNANYFGPDSYQYTIDDKDGGTSTGTVTITVNSVNDAPVALDGSVPTFDEDESRTFFLNATDIEGNPLTFIITSTSDPARGMANLDDASTGQVTYAPNQTDDGDVILYFRADDQQSVNNLSNIGSVTISINDRPVANAQAGLLVNENSALAITLTGSDPDNLASSLTYSITTVPQNGTLTGVAPNLVYTPAFGFYGNNSFQFTVTDPRGMTSNPATVSITVNALPRATDDTANTDEDTSVVVSVLANDNDPDLDPITITSVSSVSGWTTSINANGTITFNPKVDFAGSEFFTYTISDGRGGTGSAEVTINVLPVNDPPVANSESVSTDEDNAVPITLSAFDADLDPLTYTMLTMPSQGGLSGIEPFLTYTPDPDYNGPDSFTFKVNDGEFDSNTATISITVQSVNDPPIALNDGPFNIDEDSSPTIITVLDNDSDPEGSSLAIISVTNPPGGFATITGGGTTITYDSDPDENGIDTFTYTISDGTGGTDTATVTIDVDPIQDRPEADSQSGLRTRINEDMPITLSGSDADGDPITYIIVDAPLHGTLSGTEPLLTYSPNTGYAGPDSLTFKVNDGIADSNIATISLTVNTPPVANDQSVSATEDVAGTITLTSSDVDGDPRTYSIVTAPLGTISGGSGATRTYTPPANYVGQDSFTFRANDGLDNSAEATVTITIGPVNDDPTADNDSGSVAEDVSSGVTISVLGNDDDIDGDTLAVTSLGTVSPAGSGTASITGGGTSVTFVPSANFNGAVSFTYTVSDGNGGTDSATVSITVTAVNDSPVASNDSYPDAKKNVVHILHVRANDNDVDIGDTLTIQSVTQPSNCASTCVTIINGGADVQFAAPNTNGVYAFQYTVQDSAGATSTATVTVTVTNGGQTYT